MKIITNCAKCREKIFKQLEQEFLKGQYAIYKDLAYTFACYTVTAVLMALIRRGRTKKYIQEMFNDLVLIFDTSDVFGKEINLTDMMKKLETEYEIDYKRIHVHIESEEHFLRGFKRD